MKRLLVSIGLSVLLFPLYAQVTHRDHPYTQEYAIKYTATSEPQTVESDRNGNIQLLSNGSLKKLSGGELLLPGTIVDDNSYRFMKDKAIVDIAQLDGQFVYLDKRVIFSNAWAGTLYIPHDVEDAVGLIPLSKTEYVVYGKNKIQYLKDGKSAWSTTLPQSTLLEVVKGNDAHQVLILTDGELLLGELNNMKTKSLYKGNGFVSVAQHGNEVIIAHKSEGLYFFNESYALTRKNPKLPSLALQVVRSLNGELWVGSKQGAFRMDKGGEIKYYASKRWLVDDGVVDIKLGTDGNMLILTDKGLSKIISKTMTLAEKAIFYENQVRARHIRNGFNSTLSGMTDGDISTGYMSDSDNDGLWTSMYLAGQAFRYVVTKDPEALQNTRESLDAMDRLYGINPIKGFPARSFERTGHINELADPERWQKSPHKDWDWKATTSSDEAIGHIFAFGVIAEIIEDRGIKDQAIRLIDSLMSHIVAHEYYLIDYDGKPTEWGKWNPTYVNGFSKNVGDRKLNSSNIIAMLQTAYHFTKKEIFKTKAFELMDKHGYLENLMRPMDQIGKSDGTEDDLSQLLSVYWNHSDDEMYFLGYWGLYRYAFNKELKEKFKEAIVDHWKIELPEKEALWNIITAMTGIPDCGMNDAVWYLQKYPLDLIHWNIKNSDRKDIEMVEGNFRNQYTKVVLPPDELKISRHNANRFVLDGGNGGRAENSAGDIWLLPYWMGRYLQIIH
ncbi:hypothetical protein [Sphingobacterium sp. SYP-B4668]|uniref:hypothetical protein n=1 Tax=Sphingobacterium sp. SYP-B4668 TaxID=2996035 RepID=UPI0022DE774F|nr:hypothetical protein [Sphingobacterium sp. SYP-B4668]